MQDETAAPASAGAMEDVRPDAELPEGDYAIVEVLGHRTYVGRVTEVARFGATLMSIEPLFAGELLPAVLVGGGSIYQFTPCSAAIAAARMPKKRWQLPASILATLPATALPAPNDGDDAMFGEIDLDQDDLA